MGGWQQPRCRLCGPPGTRGNKGFWGHCPGRATPPCVGPACHRQHPTVNPWTRTLFLQRFSWTPFSGEETEGGQGSPQPCPFPCAALTKHEGPESRRVESLPHCFKGPLPAPHWARGGHREEGPWFSRLGHWSHTCPDSRPPLHGSLLWGSPTLGRDANPGAGRAW